MTHKVGEEGNWDVSIKAKHSYFEINIKEVWQYRDLLRMFIVRDIVSVYKQTILGPLWFILQPVLTAFIYSIIFGNVAKLPTDGVPKILFYLGSVTLWNYFADTFRLTSRTFADNSAILGKVYFPRLILPLSKVISGIIKLLIQFALFIVIWLYYLYVQDAISPNWHMVLLPFIIAVLAVFSLGSGILVSSLTVKYRDLSFLITFGIQLLLYGTPVIYPMSSVPERMRPWVLLNPLTSLIEAFKYAFFGQGMLDYFWLSYTVAFTLVVTAAGIVVFNKVEKKFIDTV